MAYTKRLAGQFNRNLKRYRLIDKVYKSTVKSD